MTLDNSNDLFSLDAGEVSTRSQDHYHALVAKLMMLTIFFCLFLAGAGAFSYKGSVGLGPQLTSSTYTPIPRTRRGGQFI